MSGRTLLGGMALGTGVLFGRVVGGLAVLGLSACGGSVALWPLDGRCFWLRLWLVGLAGASVGSMPGWVGGGGGGAGGRRRRWCVEFPPAAAGTAGSNVSASTVFCGMYIIGIGFSVTDMMKEEAPCVRVLLKMGWFPLDVGPVHVEVEEFCCCLSATDSTVVAGNVVAGAQVVVRWRWLGLRCVEFTRLLTRTTLLTGAVLVAGAHVVGRWWLNRPWWLGLSRVPNGVAESATAAVVSGIGFEMITEKTRS